MVPELCRYYGIVIKIHFNEHGPPHFHASYSGNRALIDIGNLNMLEGRLPPRARRLVAEWASLHRVELRAAGVVGGEAEGGEVPPGVMGSEKGWV